MSTRDWFEFAGGWLLAIWLVGTEIRLYWVHRWQEEVNSILSKLAERRR